MIKEYGPIGTPASYAALGVQPVINAAGRFTALGGSVMPDDVLEAMMDAARCHVPLEELQVAAGRRVAELTRNEAAHVTTGAAAAIVLCVLAATTGTDPIKIRAMAEGRMPRPEVIVQRGHHMQYVPAIRLAGADVVEVGNVLHTDQADIAAAITDRTAAILHVAGAHLERGTLGLAPVVEVAQGRAVAVLVDAAAQLPPVANLWRFTKEGAAAAIFSGGKDLCGPQASGLIVGSADLVTAARLHGAPNQRLGRAFKTGKEEIMGLVAAVERYVALDHDSRSRAWGEILDGWEVTLRQLRDISVHREALNEAGQPIPRTIVTWLGPLSADDVVSELLSAAQPLAVAAASANSIALTPETVSTTEAECVGPLLLEYFSARLRSA